MYAIHNFMCLCALKKYEYDKQRIHISYKSSAT